MRRHVLLLPNLLSLDIMPQIKPSQACHGNTFIGKLSMEQDGSLQKSFACPLFKYFWVS